VIVVGAGMAGARAATLLHAAGLRVCVLEARERCGGRLHSVAVAGVTVDAGGQWIGPGQERMLALVREHGLTLVPTWTRGSQIFESDGKPVRRRWMLPPLSVSDMVRGWQLVRALGRAAAQVDVNAPWKTEGAARLDQQSLREWLAAEGAKGEVMEMFDDILSAMYCRSIADISSLEAHHQLATIGGWRDVESADKWFLVEGTQTLVQRMATALRDRVHYGCAVDEVSQTDDGVVLAGGGRTWRARWTVITVPPACASAIRFAPALPSVTAGVSDAMQPGDVIKVVAVYESPWWRERGLSGTCMTQSTAFSATFDTSPPDGRVGVLMGFAAADGAGRAREAGTSLEQQFEDYVRTWLGRGNAPAPLAVHATDWTIDPFSQGGYAARRTKGSWTNPPIANGTRAGRFFFAGTETATVWRSYMEGALQSAERAVEEVLGEWREG
jgi:monoamine oxidase